MKYLYKNIECFESYGRWYADYVDIANNKKFALHRASTATKALAKALAKIEVDYLNGKE